MPESVNFLTPYRFVSQDTLAPGFEQNGFPDRASAEYWRDRACGIACVQMLLYAHQGQLIPAGHLVAEGVGIGAYRPGVGWVHTGLAALLTRHGLVAEAKLLPVTALTMHMLRGGTAILSVTPTLGMRRPVPDDRSSRRGHLVLCHGFSVLAEDDLHDVPMAQLLISDPDHEFPLGPKGELVSFGQVERAWSGRCIVIEPLRGLFISEDSHVD